MRTQSLIHFGKRGNIALLLFIWKICKERTHRILYATYGQHEWLWIVEIKERMSERNEYKIVIQILNGVRMVWSLGKRKLCCAVTSITMRHTTHRTHILRYEYRKKKGTENRRWESIEIQTNVSITLVLPPNYVEGTKQREGDGDAERMNENQKWIE